MSEIEGKRKTTLELAEENDTDAVGSALDKFDSNLDVTESFKGSDRTGSPQLISATENSYEKENDTDSSLFSSGSSSIGSSGTFCDDGTSTDDADEIESIGSMELIPTENPDDTPSQDVCEMLDEIDKAVIPRAVIRKCRGLEGDGDDEEETDGISGEEESHQKEQPDFNYITTYEEYLDHYVTSKDLYFFESDDVARTITTLGFRVPELLTREEFADVMKEIQAKRFAKRKDDTHIAFGIANSEISCPLMIELAKREISNRTGNLACIIYVRSTNKKGQEIAGWIDFKLRLMKDGPDAWIAYFTGKRRLIPRPSDLCYYNWTTFQIRYNSSDNYLVTTDIQQGLQFMNKLDRKLITVNPKLPAGDNTNLLKVKSPNYLDSLIYDHFLRVKA